MKGVHIMSVQWQTVREYTDIKFEKAGGIAKVTINRPEVRNAFRPKTLFELIDAFNRANEDPEVGVVLFTGEGKEAFCSGGDQRVRGQGGYVDEEGVPRLNALDLQRTIKYLPKPVIAVVAGYAIGGGHVLHLLCDLTIAADNAVFGQTGPRVGSFDGGWGATYLARVVGHKKAREIWYLCRRYSAQEALAMGLVNAVVPLERLEDEAVQWANEILEKSPIAIRCLKSAFNADTDGLAGLQELAGNATLLYYMTEEAGEGVGDGRPSGDAARRRRPGPGGHGGGGPRAPLPPAAVPGRAGGRRADPDWHQLRQRPVRLPQGRRHDGAPGPRARDSERRDFGACGCVRHGADLRRGGAGGALPRRRGRPANPADWPGIHRRGHPLYRWPLAAGLSRAGRR